MHDLRLLAPTSGLAHRYKKTTASPGPQPEDLVRFSLKETVSQIPPPLPPGLSTSWAPVISRSFWELLEPAVLLQPTGTLCPSQGHPLVKQLLPWKRKPTSKGACGAGRACVIAWALSPWQGPCVMGWGGRGEEQGRCGWI